MGMLLFPSIFFTWNKVTSLQIFSHFISGKKNARRAHEFKKPFQEFFDFYNFPETGAKINV